MTQVTAAASAQNFIAGHTITGISLIGDTVFGDRLIEGRPTGAAFELGVGDKERQVAPCTEVRPFAVFVPILSGKGTFRPLFPQYIIGKRR
jgi:hypothetical protein